jgi:hypothetical protein
MLLCIPGLGSGIETEKAYHGLGMVSITAFQKNNDIRASLGTTIFHIATNE